MALALSDYPELARYMDGPGRDPRDADLVRPTRCGVPPVLVDPLLSTTGRLDRPADRGAEEVEAER